MDKEALLLFLGQLVTLVKDDDGLLFVIDGTIKQVFDTSILFNSHGKDLIIDFTRIKEVRQWRRIQ